jgi:N6-adenosine-specific RNA methylase IME4
VTDIDHSALELARIDKGSPAPIAKAMAALAEMEEALHNAETFEDVQKIRKAADALKSLYREYKEVADRAGEVRITADVIIGTKLAEQPKAKGAQPIGRNTMLRPTDDAPAYSELGIPNRTQAFRLQRVAAIPECERKAAIAALKADPAAHVTTAAMMRLITHKQQEERVAAIRKRAAVFSSDGPFHCMVIDPPWEIQKVDRDVRPNQAVLDYPCMTEAELIDFWQRELAKRAEPDCHIFLWTTEKHLHDSFHVLSGFGARSVFTMVWHKPGGYQPLDLAQYNCEFVQYGRIGTPLFIDTKNFPCCFDGARREHSRKPDEFYDLVRRVTAGPRIDVFSREKREGFAQYGNEIEKFTNGAAEPAS